MKSDSLKIKVDGVHIVDTITNVVTGKVETIHRDHNLVMSKILPLITGMLKNSLQGIQYWAVGKGVASWDSTPINPTISEEKLTSEIGRKAIPLSAIQYADPTTYEDSANPTNCIKIGCIFSESECNGEWREFGIFGGNATATKDSGYMIDKKHHEVLTKTEEMVVDRKIFLTISFS